MEGQTSHLSPTANGSQRSGSLKQRAVITESSLVMEARDALQTYQTAISNIDFARQRLIAAQERVREDLLRLRISPVTSLKKCSKVASKPSRRHWT